jgi:virulence-associated protein VapD
MKQVIEKNGAPIQGLFRNDQGHILVNDPTALRKVMTEQQKIQEIETLKSEVTEIKSLLKNLIDKLKV